MIDALNKTIVNDTFNQAYNEEQFKLFIKDLLIDANFEKAHNIMLPNDYKDFIKSARRICKYKYTSEEYFDEKVIDILIVKLKKTTSVERARVAQRNFVARYLNGSRDYQKDAALVAFISEDENENISPDWRFSFIQMNYKTEIVESPNGKKKRVTSVELTPAKRFSFLVGENEDTHTAQKQFATCLEKSSKGEKITIEDLVQAFDIEKVSKEFFDKYKTLYLKLRDELNRLCKEDKIVNKDFAEHNINVDDFAKKTLGQLVFLYFIQKKGWLGVEKDKDWGTGDKRFLRNVFDKKYGEYNNFFNDILEHLFYEALATDRGQPAWFDKLNCRIPFLNGGLFEPVNGYEYQKTDLTINNNIFKEIFDTFDLYNFTVKEDEPLEKEVAIDPEMLGKVFENLLPENERKGNGAFYTPREIVHYMCQESLINYLYNKINIKEVPLTEEEKNQQLSLLKTKKEKEQLKLTHEVIEEIIPKEDIEFLIKTGNSTYINKQRGINVVLPEAVQQNARLLDNALTNIKVCDPAIGSGAFPVGMMNEIVRARATLSEFIQPDRSIYQFKRNAIENSIYGVDKDPGAVDIAKLRFWLSLVVDEEDIKNIKPLPNLDYKIMQGNSLITSYEGIDFDEIVDKQVKEKQLGLFSSASEKITDRISYKQKEFLKTPYPTKKAELKQKIEDLIVELVKTKFEEKADKEGRSKDFYEEQIRNFAQNKEKRNFFPWKLFFADVFEEGGFDVVIGNPPYVDSETMINKGLIWEREYISQNYQSAKGNWDLYIPFFEKGEDILKKIGNLTYITPNKWLSIGYGAALREMLVSNFSMLCRCDKIKVFDAGNSPVITFFENKKYNDNLKIQEFDISKEIYNIGLADKSILEDDNWGIFLSDKLNLIFKINSSKKTLRSSDYCVENPFATNEAYALRDIVVDIMQYNQSEQFKLINTGTIDPYVNLWGNKVTSYLKLKFNNPVVKKEDLKSLLPKRYDQSITPKIIITGMRYFECFYDTLGEYIAGKSTIIIKGDNLYDILGILNSKLISFYIKQSYSALGIDGGINFSKDLVLDLPLPKKNYSNLKNNVQKIIELTKTTNYFEDNQKQQAVKEYENQIDIMVYKLYDLNYQEVLIIDPDFNNQMSEEDYNNYKV